MAKLTLSIDRCPIHPKFWAIAINHDGGGVRLTPSKCCGRWHEERSWPIDDRMRDDIARELGLNRPAPAVDLEADAPRFARSVLLLVQHIAEHAGDAKRIAEEIEVYRPTLEWLRHFGGQMCEEDWQWIIARRQRKTTTQ